MSINWINTTPNLSRLHDAKTRYSQLVRVTGWRTAVGVRRRRIILQNILQERCLQ